VATNFPSSVDDASTVGDNTHPSADELLSSTDGGPAHHALHQNVGLAINAIEDKVGTGASTPAANSVLAGTGSGTSAWTTGTLANDISGNAATATSATSATTATNLSGGSVAATTLTASGDANFDSGTLFVDVSEDRVGVGTTTPESILHLNPGTDQTPDANGVGHLMIDGNGYTSFLTTDGTGTWVGGNSASRAMILATNETARLTVTGAGDVGINTTSPAGEFELTANTPEMIFSSSPNKTNRYRFDANFTDSADFGFSTSYWNGSAYVRAITLLDNGRVGIGTTGPSTTLDVNGSLSKSSGSFRIPHPLPAKADTHDLVHSFVEAPQADNLYRGQVALTNGAATVDLDAAANMTTGTFPLLNRDVQCFIANNQGWTAVRGSVSGSTLSIEAQDASCTDTVDWLVIGERHDQHMFDTEWTDDEGRVIVEPLRPAAPESDPETA